MVLILTDGLDSHADLVIEMLRFKGAKYSRFDTSSVPTNIGITVKASGDEQSDRLTLDGQVVPLEIVTTVWNRRPMPPYLPPEMSAGDRKFASKETDHLLEGLWGRLADRFWVNWFVNDRLAHRKPYQLKVATEVGLEVP